MLKTSGSTESITRSGKDGVGIGGNGGADGSGDSGDDGGYDDKHLPRDSEQAHQRTHQLVRPGLWSCMMRLIEIRVMLLASRSKGRPKSRRIVKSQKTSKAWRVAKVIGLGERLSKHQSSINEELELPWKLWQFFKLLLLGPEALSIPLSDRLSTR